MVSQRFPWPVRKEPPIEPNMADLNVIPVSSAEDPRIEDYVSVRERDLTGRKGKFIVEGKVTLDVFIRRSRFDVDSVFLERSRIDILGDLLKSLPPTVPIYVAHQTVMDQIVGFPIHRGILACGRKDSAPPLDLWIEQLNTASTLVLCVGLSNHDNTGAVFRNAAALGADGVILDDESCDPLYRKSIRVSAGTALWLPFHHGTKANAAMDALSTAGFDIWTLTPGKASQSLYTAPRPEKLCVVLGPEGPGLSDELIAKGQPIFIPMAKTVDSLNVATSLAITLSHRLSG